MGEDKITIQEACKILHRSEKQVRRHIKTGRLSAEIGQDGKYYILKNDVDTMARHPERMQVDKVAGHIERLDKRIAEIKNRLDILSMQVEKLTTMDEKPPVDVRQVNIPTPQIKASQPHSTTIPELPEGTLHFHDWLMAYGLKDQRRKILGYMENRRNGLKHEAYPKVNRPSELDRYLTPDQQDMLITWLTEKHPEVFEQ